MRPNTNKPCKSCNRAPLHLALEIWGQENGTQIHILYELLENGADPTIPFSYVIFPFIYICERGYIEPAKVIAGAILKESEILFDEIQYNSLTRSEDFQKEMRPYIKELKAGNREAQLGRQKSPSGTLHIEEAQGRVERDSSDPVKSDRKSRLRNPLKRVVRER